MRVVRLVLIGVAVLGLILAVTGDGQAAEKKFPTKPIQVVIPFQPGDTDNILRPFIEKMPEYLGQPLTYVYKPGAAGSIGIGFVAASKPDGYTLVGSSQSGIVAVPLTHKDVGYTWESFAPVCCLVEGQQILAVQSSAPWKNLQELVADAKKSPGQISYTGGGTFSTAHLIGEGLSKEAGIKLNWIPSQGGGPTITALLGGHVQVASTPLAPAIPHIRAGTLRCLVVYNQKRVRALPDVPCLLELGYTLYYSNLYGLLAPKGTPKEKVETIHLAAKKVVENHKAFVEDRLDKLGAEIGFVGPEEYTNTLKRQHDILDKVLKELKK